jgi:hypothetical protein
VFPCVIEENVRHFGWWHRREEKCIKILAGKHEGKRPLAKHKRKWEDNIRMGLR